MTSRRFILQILEEYPAVLKPLQAGSITFEEALRETIKILYVESKIPEMLFNYWD